jgi:hypothetical protein
MLDGIVQWLLQFDDPERFNFRLGYLAGVLVVLLLLAGFKLLQVLLFGESGRSAGVAIRNEHGTLFITATAIADLVRAVCLEYPRLELSKVSLRTCKDGLRLELALDADCDGGNFPDLTAEVQKRILAELNERFGIDAIRRVDVQVKHLLASRGRSF